MLAAGMLRNTSLFSNRRPGSMALFIPQDRKAFADWIKGNTTEEAVDDLLAALPSLKLGEGFVIAPQLGVLKRRKFPPIRTWGSMRAPEEGGPAGPDTWTAANLDAVRAEGENVREAEENDPVRLKAEIATQVGIAGFG
jgi:hypothetical protein